MTRTSKRRNSLTVQTPTIAQPTFGQTVKQGIAFGVGQTISHRIMGGGVSRSDKTEVSVPRSDAKPEFIQCMKESNYDIEACKQYK
jgi:hypothetical protein